MTRLDLLRGLSDKKGFEKLKKIKPVSVPRPESVRPKRTASKWVEWAKGVAKAMRR